MFYADLKDKPEGLFKRLAGIRPATFLDMSAALKEYLPSFGRPPKLCREDRLLLTLMYWRECRTEAHIAQTYGVSEATVCRTIQAVENALMRSGKFRLPGKMALSESNLEYRLVVMDATESPVERPKKDSAASIAGRRSGTPRKPKSSPTR